MTWRSSALVLLASLTVALAGCAFPDESTPEESTEAPDDGGNATVITPTTTLVAPTPNTTESNATTTPTPSPVASTPEPTPSATPVPTPVPPPQSAPQPTPVPPPQAAPPPAASPTPPPASTPAPTPAPTPPPEPTSWPREGSHVTIEATAGESYPSTFSNSSRSTATWTYRDGDWHGTCSGDWTQTWENGTVERGTFSATFDASSPPHWPLFATTSPPAVGSEVDTWVLWDCRISGQTMRYSGTETHGGFGTTHNADDEQIAEENYSDFDEWWDPGTGLVLEWSWSRSHSGTSGRVVSTDAPVYG